VTTPDGGRGLRPVLGLRGMVVFGLSFMVPIAPFGVFGSVFAASRGQVVGAYLVGAAVMGLTASSFVVMAREYAGVGSVHTFVGRAVGPVAGFLAGWMLLLDYLLVPALIALITANGLHAAVPAVPVTVWVVALVAVAMALNLVGIARVVAVGAALLAVQLAVVAVFVGAAVTALAGGAGRPDAVAAPVLDGSPSALLAGAAVAVLSYLGFESIATLGEENREQRATLGRAIAVALAVCAALFVVQCWCAALLVPDPAGLTARGDPDGAAFYAAADVAGGAWLVAAAALCGAGAGVANALVAQAATARLLLGFARAGQAPAALARVDARRGVPATAALLVAGLAAAVALAATATGGLATLVTLVNVGALTAFAALHAAVLVRFAVRGRSRRPAHLLVPVLGVATIAAVVVSSADVARSLGAAWLALGAAAAVGLRRSRPSGEDEPQVVDGGGA
jgi:amino acid transporter